LVGAPIGGGLAIGINPSGGIADGSARAFARDHASLAIRFDATVIMRIA